MKRLALKIATVFVGMSLSLGVAACGSAQGGGGRGGGHGGGKGHGRGGKGGKGGWGGDAQEEALKIAVSTPATGTIERRYEASGTLRARRAAEIRPVQTAVITKLFFEEGDAVKEGDRMAKLDGRELALMAARDRIAAQNARRELDRLEGITNSDAIAQQEIDLKRFELESAKAAAKLSRHQASLAEVRAPFDGTVTARNVDTGNLATTSTVIYAVADMSVLELDVYLPEREAADVDNGAAVNLELVDGTAFTGEVVRRAPVVDPLTGTVKFTVEIDERPERAVPGAFTRARVLLDAHRDVMTVARGAMFQLEGDDHVYVVADGKATRRKVEVGLRDDERVEIVSGLEADELVVDDPGDGLTDGMAVDAVRTDAPVEARAEAEPAGKTKAKAKRDEGKREEG